MDQNPDRPPCDPTARLHDTVQVIMERFRALTEAVKVALENAHVIREQRWGREWRKFDSNANIRLNVKKSPGDIGC